MRKRVWLVLFIAVIIVTFSATTLQVALDGSQAYQSIQSAIEDAVDGDTVLVYPGRYYENVDFIGKSISLCSLEFTTGDSTYISTTIIDGGMQDPCIAIHADELEATVQGFTLTNGLGFVEWQTYNYRSGGGIYIYRYFQAPYSKQVNVINCDITGNRAVWGAGIYCTESSLYLSGVNIHHNYGSLTAGGIRFYGVDRYQSPNIVFDPVNLCSVYANYGWNPVDILIIDTIGDTYINLDLASVLNPDVFYIGRIKNIPMYYPYTNILNIQRGYRTEINSDFYVSPTGDNANTGLSPDQALKSIAEAVQRIASDSLEAKTVYVLPGTYNEDESFYLFPIPLKSYVNIIGAGSDKTILHSDLASPTGTNFFWGGYDLKNITIKGFTTSADNIQNCCTMAIFPVSHLTISDMILEDFSTYNYNYAPICFYEPVSLFIDSLVVRNFTVPENAIYMQNLLQDCSITNSTFENIHSTYTSPDTPGDDSWGPTVIDINTRDTMMVDNCIFRNISVQNNQATLYISNDTYLVGNVANIRVNNCLFDNIRSNYNSAVCFYTNIFGSYKVSNCTFYNNYGTLGAVMAGGKVDMQNNIFYNPDAQYELYMAVPDLDSYCVTRLDFDYNNIRNGYNGIRNSSPTNDLYYGEHNFTSEPLFASNAYGDSLYLHLGADSPCINAGTPDTTGLGLLPYDLAGNWRIWNGRIDMGCYEYGSEPYVGIDDPVVPSVPGYNILAYPNPFNAFTNLKVKLSSDSEHKFHKVNSASIEVYNIRGEKVKTISLDVSKGAEQLTYWDGRDQHSRLCPTGIYLLNLNLNGKSVLTRKVTLIR